MNGKMGRSAYGDRRSPMEHSARYAQKSRAATGSEGSRGSLVERETATAAREVTPEGVFETLIAGAQESGKLASEDVAGAFEELELDAAQMDDFYSRLDELQIEVVDGDADAEEEIEVEVDQREVSTEALQLFLKDIGK